MNQWKWIFAVISLVASSALAHDGWFSPFREKYRVTDCLGTHRSSVRNHAGLDLNSWPIGEPRMATAIAEGVIKNAGWRSGYGCSIMVQHDNCPNELGRYKQFAKERCVSFYAHLRKLATGACPATRRRGHRVGYNEGLARMGNTGGNYPVHLHFELRNRADNLRLNSLIAIPDVLLNAAFVAVKSPNACNASRRWIAYSPQGKGKIRSLQPANFLAIQHEEIAEEKMSAPWPEREPPNNSSDAEVDQAAAELNDSCVRGFRAGHNLGRGNVPNAQPEGICQCLVSNMRVARNLDEMRTVAHDYLDDLDGDTLTDEQALYVHEATKLEANCIADPSYRVGENEPR